MSKNMDVGNKEIKKLREIYHRIVICYFSGNIFIAVESTITEFELGSATHCRQKDALKRKKNTVKGKDFYQNIKICI